MLTAMLSARVCAAPLPVILRNGEPHVSSGALERESGIVVKRLPGRGEFIVCGTRRCAPLKSVLADGNTFLVPVSGLSEAMNLTANFDEGRQHVALASAPGEFAATEGAARVGAIAPNFRLTKLDGSPVSLDELRGQRVLINSWASW